MWKPERKPHEIALDAAKRKLEKSREFYDGGKSKREDIFAPGSLEKWHAENDEIDAHNLMLANFLNSIPIGANFKADKKRRRK